MRIKKIKTPRNRKRLLFTRVNKSICISEDNTQWRNYINRSKSYIPKLIRMQGRSSISLYISNVNKYIDTPIINEEEKTIHYKRVKCDICHIGYIQMNKNSEPQCDHCGYLSISEDLYTRNYIDMDDDCIKESINNRNKNLDTLKFYWMYPINKNAKELNARIKRIREYEKGNKDYQT